MKQKNKRCILPNEKLLLKILNREEQAKSEAIDFYERYIKEMATEPVYSKDGTRSGYFYNEDLAQELRMALSACLPALREVLVKRHFTNRPIVLVLTDLTEQSE